MRYHTDRTADALRRLILSRPTVSAAHLARICGITIQQVAGYRAAHTVKTQRARPASSSPRGTSPPRAPTTQHRRPAQSHRTSTGRANTRIPQRLAAQLRTARKRAEHSLTGYLTKALRASTLIATTLETLDRRL